MRRQVHSVKYSSHARRRCSALSLTSASKRLISARPKPPLSASRRPIALAGSAVSTTPSVPQRGPKRKRVLVCCNASLGVAVTDMRVHSTVRCRLATRKRARLVAALLIAEYKDCLNIDVAAWLEESCQPARRLVESPDGHAVLAPTSHRNDQEQEIRPGAETAFPNIEEIHVVVIVLPRSTSAMMPDRPRLR